MSTYLTPGPSQPYPKMREYLQDAWNQDIVAISHRGKGFSNLYRRADEAIRKLMGIPDEYGLMFLGSATEAMERLIQGVVVNRSHHFVTGAFGEKWYEIAAQLGKDPTVKRVTPGQVFAPEDLTAPSDARLVCVTENETSTGAEFPREELALLGKLPNRPLVAVDVVSSVPIVQLDWGVVDAALFSVQKAFGLPAGLGVLIASPRTLAKATELHASGMSVGSFHSLPELAAGAVKFQTPATPNVLNIYLLGRVAEDMLLRGVDNLREENRERAGRLYEVLEHNEHLEPFVKDKRWQSSTVIVASVRGGSAQLRDSMAEEGLVVGQGYSAFKEAHLRIANFPALSEDKFEELLAHLKKYAPNSSRYTENLV